jgi:hypothetical protein
LPTFPVLSIPAAHFDLFLYDMRERNNRLFSQKIVPEQTSVFESPVEMKGRGGEDRNEWSEWRKESGRTHPRVTD